MSQEEITALGRDDMLAADITYRQLDYWCRSGWLRPYHASPGSGIRRFFPPAELEVARAMVLLIKAGVAPPVAARAARDAAETGLAFGLLTDNVAVMWVDA